MNLDVNSLKKALCNLYNHEGAERVGFILNDGSVIEVRNAAMEPEKGFEVSGEDIIKYATKGNCLAVWHTHPGKESNLSGEDLRAVTQWSDLVHFVIGNDGVSAYRYNVEKKAVVII